MSESALTEPIRKIPDGCPFRVIMATVSDNTYGPDRAVVHTADHLPRPQLWMRTDLDGEQWQQIIDAATLALPTLQLPSGKGNHACLFCSKVIESNGSLSRHVAKMHLAKLGIDYCYWGDCPRHWRPVRPSSIIPVPPEPQAPPPVDPLALLASGGIARRTYRTRIHVDVLSWLNDAVAANEQPAFIDRSLARMMALRGFDPGPPPTSETAHLNSVFWAMTHPKRRHMVAKHLSMMDAVLDAWLDRWPWLFSRSPQGASSGFTTALFWALYEIAPQELEARFPFGFAYFLDDSESWRSDWLQGATETWRSTAITEHDRRCTAIV